MIYYGLLDKASTPESRIACIVDRSAIVKFYVYTTGKSIFCMKSIVQWCSSGF